MSLPNSRLICLLAGIASLGLAGCGSSKSDANPETGANDTPLRPVILQTDWYAQAEHGGYYQAAARGFDREEGIQLTIQPGGPGSFGVQRVATGSVQFSMGRSDDILLAIQEGLPIVIVTALMQHDPQGLLMHASNPINSFADLDGKAIMTTPGATFIRFLENRYNIRINIVPLNYGLAQFFADKNFIQQCFITNEPFYVRRNGFEPKVLLIADSGFDPYRVIFTNQRFLRENPATVQAFVNAATRGWYDFLHGDPTPGMAMIRSHNEKMDDEFMLYSIDAMKRYQLVEGRKERNGRIGLIQRERITEQMQIMLDTGLLRAPIPLERIVAWDITAPVVGN
jgi:NitT/TauT family transport system substrate-binding protein